MSDPANSFTLTVVVPTTLGIVGLLVLGPVGFFAGLVFGLLVGPFLVRSDAEKDERIEELEARVRELEADRGGSDPSAGADADG